MKSFSVITLVRNREKQLRNMLQSVAMSEVLPVDVVVVRMELKNTSIEKDFPELDIKQVVVDDGALPLAKARNVCASHATGETLVFVDVDCICSPTLFSSLLTHNHVGVISSASVKYLSEVPSEGHYLALEKSAITHPNREEIPNYTAVRHTLFWSLIFAINRQDFLLLKGFDEAFIGYGGEDTDFAERFHQKGMRLEFIDEYVLHQYHPKYDPPLNHVVDICTNANYFKQKHGYFPMYTWLNKFCELGFLQFVKPADRYNVVRQPTKNDLSTALSLLPY
ncbi:glycosyltransferase family 2 protein [Alteromonas sp. ASW11-130]|uniref:glycosyltransferase family 2 protein n=1 Tax=Alteromonas sp. ASW11-130 TaxID=3015775 RepID=UPI00224239B5|nr:galactosyltransferase-related protein [Alteromonas sp. ASW11-130]MCW8092340.1 galactosyltransferase-related protein [Alteromonas sp. ASW11-130]